MVDMERFLTTSLNSFVSVDLNTSWAAKSWDPAFSYQQERARFQQRQLQEKEEKLMKLYEEQQERSLQKTCPRPPVRSSSSGPPMAVGAGRVRNLLQSRRDLGRDKSYPLDPIPRTKRPEPPPQRPVRTQSLDPGRNLTRSIPRASKTPVLYFGGSQQDLHFSDELDYGQSFQVIDDQLLYDAPRRPIDSDDTDEDIVVKSFKNKRQFYENRFAGVYEERDSYDPKAFHKLPNVGLNGSFNMNEKPISPPGKYKNFVSGGSTLKKVPQRTGLPTRQQSLTSPATKKVPELLPPTRPRLGLESPTEMRNGSPPVRALRTDSPPAGQVNGRSTPPRPLNGSPARKSPLSPPQRSVKIEDTARSTVPPVPASRTTVPRPSSAKQTPTRKATPSRTTAEQNGRSSCHICGRNFASDRLQTHEVICQKAAAKKRKVFDPVKQRVKGTEAEKYVLSGISAKNAKQAELQKQKTDKSSWRRKHEDFINSIRAAKEVKAHLQKGGKLSDLPPPPPSDYSDYTQCPHCQRKFNQTAAERHIPLCANMQHNKTSKKTSAPLKSSSTFKKK